MGGTMISIGKYGLVSVFLAAAMKKDPITSLLLVLLTFCVIAIAGVSFAFVTGMRTLHIMQNESAQIARTRTVAQSLAADTIEYSKRNPAILPLLKSVGIRAAGTETNKSQIH
jgi:hypothetical protein